MIYSIISMALSAWLLFSVFKQNKEIRERQEKWAADYEEINRILDKIKRTLPEA